MKKLKTLLILIFCLSLLSSCGESNTASSTPQTDDETSPLTATVCFREGWNTRQYASALEENGVCSEEDFFRAVNEIDYSADYTFLPSFSELADRIYKLEGYLFPDTYEFYINSDAETVVRKLLSNFQKKYDNIFSSIQNSDMTFDEALILASIVERETPSVPEMNKIAAVFVNRLNSPDYPRLQSDATWWYPYIKGESDIPNDFVGEYNTYNVDGLPKGPVCNPSADAIAASLEPDTSCTAFFFFTDNNGKHYYADTYSQHKKNIAYCKENGLY